MPNLLKSLPREILDKCDVVFLCLFDSDAVNYILSGENGLLCEELAGKTIIDLETGKEIPGEVPGSGRYNQTIGELCQLKDLTSDYRLNQKPGFSIIKWNEELLERLIKNIDQSPY